MTPFPDTRQVVEHQEPGSQGLSAATREYRTATVSAVTRSRARQARVEAEDAAHLFDGPGIA